MGVLTIMKFVNAFCKGTVLALLAGLMAAQSGKAETINLSGVLNGAQLGVNTPWTGAETATLNTTTDLFSWDVGFTFSDTAVYGVPDMAHFHFGPPGVIGPIQIPLADTSTTNPLTPIPTSFVGSQTVTATQAEQIAGGLWYAEIHTNVFPLGIIRGQLTATPEPASLLLLGGGIGLLGLARMWRSRRA
jgi:CHRD domain/PEP-CTERM motif